PALIGVAWCCSENEVSVLHAGYCCRGRAWRNQQYPAGNCDSVSHSNCDRARIRSHDGDHLVVLDELGCGSDSALRSALGIAKDRLEFLTFENAPVCVHLVHSQLDGIKEWRNEIGERPGNAEQDSDFDVLGSGRS